MTKYYDKSFFKNIRQKGYTLVEVLIASVIFAMVIIMATGTFSWAAGYNGKIAEMRRVSQTGRNISNQLSSDIRLANGSAKTRMGDGTIKDLGEITLLKFANERYEFFADTKPVRFMTNKDYQAWESESANLANAILILQRDQGKAIIYRTIAGQESNFDLEKLELPVFLNNQEITFSNFQGTKLNDFANLSSRLILQGYGPAKSDANKKQQSYAEFMLIFKSRNYETLDPNIRDRFVLTSTVETRDYNY